MKQDEINNIIENKIKKLKNNWYDFWEYEIEDLINWFINIWDSLFLTAKEKLSDTEKMIVRKTIISKIQKIEKKWVYDFWEIIQKLNEDVINKDLKDKKIILLNKEIFEKWIIMWKVLEIEKNIKFVINTKENKVISSPKDEIIKISNKYNYNELIFMAHTIKNILIENYDILITYLSDKNNWNEDIKKYKNILLEYYKSISKILIKNKENLWKLYKNSNEIFNNQIDFIFDNSEDFINQVKFFIKIKKISDKLKLLKIK